MPQHYSFKTEVIKGDECFYLGVYKEKWVLGICRSVLVDLDKDNISITYICREIDHNEHVICSPEDVASKTAFLEWQSRLIDCAKDQFKFKGNVEKMFGPESYSNWIPFYKDDVSPSNAYMQGMGLVDFGALLENGGEDEN